MRPASALLITLVLAFSSVAEARPPLLPEEAGCELWLGEAHGNDAGVRINLRLCPQEDGSLTGEVQWSGQESGWNLRAVEGTRVGDQTTLHDVRIVEERPEPGWRFCTIERYELRAEGPDLLTGRYVSTSCNDEATMELRRVEGRTEGDSERGAEAGGTRGEAPEVEPPASEVPPPDAVQQSSGCACQAAGSRSSATMPFFLEFFLEFFLGFALGAFALWRGFRWTRRHEVS